MIWHVVHFDFTGVDDAVRCDIEQQLADLADIPEVAWLRVGRDIDQPQVTGLLTAFASDADLQTYRTHDAHVPVVEAVKAVGVTPVRFDIEAMDDPASLPR